MQKSIARLIIFLSWFILQSVNGVFPDDPQPCKYGDTECIARIIAYLMNEKYGGDASLNLMKIDPLLVKEAHIQQGEESPVSVDLLFTNNQIHGWKNAKVMNVTGFDKDMKKKHQLIFALDSLSLVGEYKIDGKILIVPIKGSGNSNITMHDVMVKITFTGKPLEKDDAVYMTIDKFDLDAEPKGITYKVENLFNGDKALSDNMNLFLNENWQDIYVEVRASLSDAFAGIYKEVLNNVFTKYPYAKFFAE